MYQFATMKHNIHIKWQNLLTEKQNSAHIIKILLIAVFILPAGCLNPQNSWTRGGITAVLSQGENGVIIKKMNGEFANKSAVLLPGDQIVKIDDTKADTLSLTEISEALTGPVGSTVVVTVLRNDRQYSIAVDRIMRSRSKKQLLKSESVSESAPENSQQTDNKENK
jgi:C-terminal processing protease CtpA/Prc